MSVFKARQWLIVVSLVLAGAAFGFFMLAPVFGYPLRISQASSVLQIVFPVFVGYLAAATQFLFQKTPPSDETIKTRPMMGLMIKGPIGLYALMMVVAIVAFGYSNRASARPGDGMTVENLTTAVSAAMGLLAVTTNGIVAYLFAAQRKPEKLDKKRPTKKG